MDKRQTLASWVSNTQHLVFRTPCLFNVLSSLTWNYLPFYLLSCIYKWNLTGQSRMCMNTRDMLNISVFCPLPPHSYKTLEMPHAIRIPIDPWFLGVQGNSKGTQSKNYINDWISGGITCPQRPYLHWKQENIASGLERKQWHSLND